MKRIIVFCKGAKILGFGVRRGIRGVVERPSSHDSKRTVQITGSARMPLNLAAGRLRNAPRSDQDNNVDWNLMFQSDRFANLSEDFRPVFGLKPTLHFLN